MNNSLPRSATCMIFGVIISVIAVIPFLVLPLLIGAAAGTLGLSESQIGFISSGIVLGVSISALLSLFWVRRIDWRKAGYAGLLLTLCCHVLSLFVSDIFLFGFLQALAGLGGGTAYSLMLAFFSDQEDADRCFGYSVGAQVTTQVVGLVLLPPLIAYGGLTSVLMSFIFLEIIALSLVHKLPRTGTQVRESSALSAIFKLKPFFALAGCFLFFFNVGVFWTYIQRIGVASGLSLQAIGFGLSVAAGIGAFGPACAAGIGVRYGRTIPLLAATIAIVIAVLFIQTDMSFITFISAVALYKFCWNYSLTYQYALVNEIDVSRKSVAAAPAFHGAGGALGPVLAALFVSASSFSVVNILVVASVIASLGCFYLAIKLPAK